MYYGIPYGTYDSKKKFISLIHSKFGFLTKHTLSHKYFLQATKPWLTEILTTNASGSKIANICTSDVQSILHSVSFDDVIDPMVSIIIPVYNQLQYTAACLASIAEVSSEISFEVIVVDDCSQDETHQTLTRIPGLHVNSNEKNLGFIRSCNKGALAARGKYVVFLNNDTIVRNGWLDRLVETFSLYSDAGLVGAKLIYPDGTLQEAGSILWADGSGWNYGRGDDPEKPEYNYAKETDYCSGACIVLPRELFISVGMFDERYCPAYYEDADLAFKVRAAGMKVYYQPAAEIVHFEGKSCGTDVTCGIKAFQTANLQKFVDRWQTALAADHLTAPQDLFFLARDRSCNKKCILIVDHHVPFFDQDAGSRAMWTYLQAFQKMGMNIKFIGDNFHPHQPYTNMMGQLGIEVLAGGYYSKNWEKWLEENGAKIHYVLLSRPTVAAKYLQAIRRCTNAKVLYWGVDLAHIREERAFNVSSDPAVLESANRSRHIEHAVWRSVDVIYYPSLMEVEYVKRRLPLARVYALPLYAYTSPLACPGIGMENREGLLFVGGFSHPPNVDAMLWFCRDVFPQILAQNGRIALTIVGSNPPPEILDLANDHIRVTGYLSDEELKRFYQNSRIAIAPLRYGAGVKGKIVEALHQGVPVVTTAIGAEGMPHVDSCLKIAGESEMASAIVALYSNIDSLEQYARLGPQYVKNNFSYEAILEVFAKEIST